METSNTKNSLNLARQVAGTEYTSITRLLILRSWKADIHNGPVDKMWLLDKTNRRSYMQQKISLQQLKIWHTFPTIRETQTLKILNPYPRDPTTYTIFPGNWSPESLANYLTDILRTSYGVLVSYDPYQLKFNFCPATTGDPPSLDIDGSSTLLPYLGFPEGVTVYDANVSAFPPYLLFGPTTINVWSNFTMNTIPFSEYLCSIPIGQFAFGQHIAVSNYDTSMGSLCLDHDIHEIRIVLKDEFDRVLAYDNALPWEITLALEPVPPEGFAPLDV